LAFRLKWEPEGSVKKGVAGGVEGISRRKFQEKQPEALIEADEDIRKNWFLRSALTIRR